IATSVQARPFSLSICIRGCACLAARPSRNQYGVSARVLPPRTQLHDHQLEQGLPPNVATSSATRCSLPPSSTASSHHCEHSPPTPPPPPPSPPHFRRPRRVNPSPHHSRRNLHVRSYATDT